MVITAHSSRIANEDVQPAEVLQNLVENAFKYRNPDRPLHLTMAARQADDGDGQFGCAVPSVVTDGIVRTAV